MQLMAEHSQNVEKDMDGSQVISKELIEEAIRSKIGRRDITIQDLKVKKVEYKDFISHWFLVNVTVDDNGTENEHRLFVKTIRDNKVIKEVILVQLKFFSKEKMAYTQILPDMIRIQVDHQLEVFGPSLPDFYYSIADNSSGVLILENEQANGYFPTDLHKGLSYEQCKIAFEELAIFHALSFAIKDKNPENLKKYDGLFHESAVTTPLSPYLKNGLKASVQLIKNFSQSDVVQRGAEKLLALDLEKTLNDLIKPVEPYALICHGDMWGNNVLFKYGNGESRDSPVAVKLLDLQLIRYAPPTTDLAYFLFRSTTRNIRNKHLKDLLRDYHQAFMKSLGNLNLDFPEFTVDVLEKMFKETALFGVLFTCMIFPTMLMKQDGSASLNIDDTTGVDLEKIFVEFFQNVVACEENIPFIQNRLVGTLEDAIEMGLI